MAACTVRRVNHDRRDGDGLPRLRGDLSKWLLEINTGVYVGQLNPRVREELWKRICKHLPRGRATMVYSANNEQRMSFHVHNTTWQPADYEGITLMRRPLATPLPEGEKPPLSKAAIIQMDRNKQSAKQRRAKQLGYVVIDVETTGLDCDKSEILELGAIRVIDHQVTDTFSALVRPEQPIPAEITTLTGITQDAVSAQGTALQPLLEQFWAFVGQSPVMGHNLDFDLAFLKKASARFGLSLPNVRIRDTLKLARRKVPDLPDHRLATLAAYFGIEYAQQHRALPDCIAAFQVYEKLNEI